MFPVLVTPQPTSRGCSSPGMNGEASVLVERRDERAGGSERRRAQRARGADARRAARTRPGRGAGARSRRRWREFGGMQRRPPAATRTAGAAHAESARRDAGSMRGEVDLRQQPQRQLRDGHRTGVRGGTCGPRQEAGRAKTAAGPAAADDERRDRSRRDARQIADDLRRVRRRSPRSPWLPGMRSGVATSRCAGGRNAVRDRGSCRRRGSRSSTGARPASASAQSPRGDRSAGEFPARGPRAAPGVVFVHERQTYSRASSGSASANFDYTEVVSGLKEGEQVALLAAAAIQAAQRLRANDRLPSA